MTSRGQPRLEDIFASQRVRIYNLCLAILRDPDDADDATQSTYEAALKDWTKLRERERAATWLLTIARNRAGDIVRDRVRRRRVLGRGSDGQEATTAVEVAESKDPSPQEIVEHRELVGELRVSLTLLSTGQREVLELYRQNHALNDISEILGIPVGTVRSRLSRGLLGLREQLVESGMELSTGPKRLPGEGPHA